MALTFPNKNRNPFKIKTLDTLLDEGFQVFDHRFNPGGSPIATINPEETPVALVYSQNINDKGLECDLRYSSDSVPVLFHDTTMDAKTDFTGSITQYKYDDLLTAQYDYFDPTRYTKQEKSLMSLYKLVRLAGMKNCLMIEQEVTTSTAGVDLANRILELGLQDYAVIQCFSFAPLDAAYALDSRIKTAYNTNTVADATTVASHNCWSVQVSATSGLTAQNVIDYHNAGLKIGVWVPDDYKTAKPFSDMGVDYIMTNDTGYLAKMFSPNPYIEIHCNWQYTVSNIGSGYKYWLGPGGLAPNIVDGKLGWSTKLDTTTEPRNVSVGHRMPNTGSYRIEFSAKCEEVSSDLTRYFNCYFCVNDDGARSMNFADAYHLFTGIYFTLRANGAPALGWRWDKVLWGGAGWKEIVTGSAGNWATYTTGTTISITLDVVINSPTSVTVTASNGIDTPISATFDDAVAEWITYKIPLEGFVIFSTVKHGVRFSNPIITPIE